MWRYKDLYGLGHPYTLIHPFKQQAVKRLVDNISGWVDYVVVFGSSIMPYCRKDSDIDVSLIGDYTEENQNMDAMRMEGQSYDFLRYASVDDLKKRAAYSIQNVERDIYERGVVVFER
jgi:predicted nucleotidyltransferase